MSGLTNKAVFQKSQTPDHDSGVPSGPGFDEEGGPRSSSGTDTPGSLDDKATLALSQDGESWFSESVFDDEKLARFYEPPPSYESRHRFDPAARWTKEEDRQVVRKCDLRLFSFICLCFAALQLDRGNIGNALSDNMLKDLGLNTNQYNTGQTLCTWTWRLQD